MTTVSGPQGPSGAENVYSPSESAAPAEVGNVPMVDSDGNKPADEVKNKQQQAKEALKADIANGNALYNESNVIGDILGFIFDKKAGNMVHIEGLPEGTTLGDIRKKYNLPPGSLRHLVGQGGGNFDSYAAPAGKNGAYFYTTDDAFAEGLGISTKELKGMFPDEAYSPWYSTGTKK